MVILSIFFFFPLSLFISFSTESGFPSILKQTNRTCFHQRFLGNFERSGGGREVDYSGKRFKVTLVAGQRINREIEQYETKLGTAGLENLRS